MNSKIIIFLASLEIYFFRVHLSEIKLLILYMQARACMRTRRHAHVCTHVHAYIHTRAHACTHARTRMYALPPPTHMYTLLPQPHPHPYTHARARVRAHAHTHTHEHARAQT